MACPVQVNSNTIELTVHNYFYCVLDLLCVKIEDTVQLPKCSLVTNLATCLKIYLLNFSYFSNFFKFFSKIFFFQDNCNNKLFTF